jgi:DNA-binding GntR family transcriptional regulator
MVRESLSSLQPLDSLSLREGAKRAIRASIIAGEIEAGVIFSAPSVAQRLGVSATPVREAMLDLANEGLVEIVRNRGFRVLAYDKEDLYEILELRMLLEPPSVGRVAGKLNSEQLKRLRQVVADMRASAQRGDLTGFLTSDHDFHLGLLAPLGNRRLVDFVARLRDQERFYGLREIVQSELFLHAHREHEEILVAVEAGDNRQAETLMLQHLKHMKRLWAGSDGVSGGDLAANDGR